MIITRFSTSNLNQWLLSKVIEASSATLILVELKKTSVFKFLHHILNYYFFKKMEGKIRIVLLDDHQMFLDLLVSILSTDERIEILGSFFDAQKALNAIPALLPDLVITDMSMPEMTGLEFTKRMKEAYPEIKILVLSMHKDKETVSDIAHSEAEGYILKNSNKSELVKAILKIADGGTYYSNEIISFILNRSPKKKSYSVEEPTLSEREKEVLTLIAQELTNHEIADKLFISKRTVETHRKNMMMKTKARSVVGLLKFAVRSELIQLN
jgi:DNA-binding NarL/FixJ family response regulator